MNTFNWSILVGSIGTGRETLIVKRLEQFNNNEVLEEFTTFIDMTILVVTIRVMLREKMLKPFNRRSFEDTVVTMLHPSKVISHKDPTGFPMETSIVKALFGILRGHTSKGEMN